MTLIINKCPQTGTNAFPPLFPYTVIRVLYIGSRKRKKETEEKHVIKRIESYHT